MAKGSGGTRGAKTSRSRSSTAGDFGFKKLGDIIVKNTMSGIGFSDNAGLTQETLAKEAQRYLDTGKWNRYGSKAGSDIARAISRDLFERGAIVTPDKNYLKLSDGSTVAITQSKVDFKWRAKVSTVRMDGKRGGMKGALDEIMNRKPKK